MVSTFPLGRFGDNHIAPAMLFDPNDPDARPPDDALDLVFRCPSSLNVMLDGMAQAGREDLLDQWRGMYAEIAEETARFVQRGGGYVTDRARSGKAPARLEITAVMHREAPGFTGARWHLHVYVGATAVSLLDDQRLPVPWESLKSGARITALRRYAKVLHGLMAERWGVRWDSPRPGALAEIVEPPWHEHIDTLERGMCPGPESWGPRRQYVIDEDSVRMAERDTAAIARREAEGRGWRPPKLLFEDEDEDYVHPSVADEAAAQR